MKMVSDSGLTPSLMKVEDRAQRRAHLLTGELLDGTVERAFLHRLDRFGQGVVADDGDVQAGGADGFDRAQRHVVIGGHDGVRRVGAQAALGHFQTVGAVEVARLLAGNLEVAGGVDDVVQALAAVDGRRCARRALQLEDDCAIREEVDQRLALGFAAQHVLGAHVGQESFDTRRLAVNGHDRDAGVHHGLDRPQPDPRWCVG